MNVLITDKMADEAIEILRGAGHNVIYEEMDQDKLLEEIPKYDALMVRGRTKVVKEIVKAGANGNIKVIGRAGIGVDNIDIDTASKYKIPIVNAPTGATASVAELAMGLMLSLSRHITKADSTMKREEWAKKQLKGTELNGKTLGLVGCGNIGRLTAKFAQRFNMDETVYLMVYLPTDAKRPLTVQSKVVNVLENGIGVKFLDVNEGTKQGLQECYNYFYGQDSQMQQE